MMGALKRRLCAAVVLRTTRRRTGRFSHTAVRRVVALCKAPKRALRRGRCGVLAVNCSALRSAKKLRPKRPDQQLYQPIDR